MRRRSLRLSEKQDIGALEELVQESDPLSGLASESNNRFWQDLQLYRVGVRTRELTWRLHTHDKYMSYPVLQDRASANMHKYLVHEALTSIGQPLTVVPGYASLGEGL